MSDQALTADLRKLLTGRVSDDPATLMAHETDHGQIVYRRPAVVVRPDGAADIAAALRYATAHGIPVSPRGTGHSLRGQSINDGGIVLDLTGLDHLSVDPEARLFRCGPGVQWRTVVAETSRYRLTPPTLIIYPHLTVGGTHSAGGWGEASFRYGAQVDNCTGLDVVTGAGERLWCDREHDPELFGHVLGGMGQFAVITEVEHRLREFQPVARTYPLDYDSPDDVLADLRRMAASGSPLHNVECTGEPRADGTWRYQVLATIEAEAPPEDCPVPDLVGRQGPPFDQPTGQFLARPQVGGNPSPARCGPAVGRRVPSMVAGPEYLDFLHRLPSALLARTESPVRLWPARHEVTATPMLRVPDTEPDMLLVALTPNVLVSGLPAVLALLSRISDLALELGGTRHLATWVHLDLPRWRLHFGSEWPKVNELKHRYDPAGILNPDFIEYEPLQRNAG